jgi:signal peptidase I
MFSDWVSFLAYSNLFGIKGFVVVVVVKTPLFQHTIIVPGDTYVYRSCCF